MRDTRFTTVAALRNWVWEHAGDNLDAAEIDQITERIRSNADFPAWGKDCTAFLESLPENLCELLDEMNPENVP